MSREAFQEEILSRRQHLEGTMFEIDTVQKGWYLDETVFGEDTEYLSVTMYLSVTLDMHALLLSINYP